MCYVNWSWFAALLELSESSACGWLLPYSGQSLSLLRP